MFNKKFVAYLMSLYGCEQLSVDREGVVYAMKPGLHQAIPDVTFDTDSAEDAWVAREEAALKMQAVIDAARA